MNLIGQKFGRLTILKISNIKISDRETYQCKCECGNIKLAMKKAILAGKVKSCGCLRVDNARLMQLKFKPRNLSRHGLAHTRPWYIWQNMKRRCNNKSDLRYGGRGIGYDLKWESFDCFWEDVKDEYKPWLTIDRIDNNKGYCKENCRWTDMKTQNRNRCSNNMITYQNHTMTLQEWAEKLNIPRNRLQNRINRKWPLDKALSQKVYPRNNTANCEYISH